MADVGHEESKVTVAILNTEGVIVAQTSRSFNRCREVGS
jgi:hypothetical protein